EATITKFSDKEIFVEIHENVRGEDVFIIQSTSFPANDNLMELLVTIDALRRGSASRITAVLPYFGYARQDRKTGPRTPISAKMVANLITTAGANRVLTMDLHAGQIQGFFDIPLDNLYAQPLFTKDIIDNNRSENLVFVSPDVGGVMRARAFAKKLDADLAIIDKRRDAPGVSAAMNVIGNVGGKKCIIIDDLVDSGGTICNAAKALKDKGATEVYGYCSHGVYSGKALENIQSSMLEEMVCTNSIKPTFEIPENMKFLSVAPLFGEAIMRINNETSISSLFD
ncbi:ribose-phosphate pyrophosphokinase, partial [Alphaproteobacteria bacterium]|nr:ribose-phosphate pyrophosphokinase [Alphaproteobacteria bacterium]